MSRRNGIARTQIFAKLVSTDALLTVEMPVQTYTTFTRCICQPTCGYTLAEPANMVQPLVNTCPCDCSMSEGSDVPSRDGAGILRLPGQVTAH